MTKQILVRQIGQRSGLTNRQSELALEALIQSVSLALREHYRIEIANFMTFEVQRKSRRVADSEDLHQYAELKCRPGKVLRAMLNGKPSP